jgi:hypothetical protein
VFDEPDIEGIVEDAPDGRRREVSRAGDELTDASGNALVFRVRKSCPFI